MITLANSSYTWSITCIIYIYIYICVYISIVWICVYDMIDLFLISICATPDRLPLFGSVPHSDAESHRRRLKLSQHWLSKRPDSFAQEEPHIATNKRQGLAGYVIPEYGLFSLVLLLILTGSFVGLDCA